MSVIEKLHNPQVYCTKCLFFRIDDECIPYCYHANECCLFDPEDSIPLLDRPCYTPTESNGMMLEGCLIARLRKINEIVNECLQDIQRISDIDELMWWKL